MVTRYVRARRPPWLRTANGKPKKAKAPVNFVTAEWSDSYVVLPVKVISEANARERWQVAHSRSRKQRETVKLSLNIGAMAEHKPKAPCVIRLVRISPRPLDSDNLQRGFKAVRDEVAAWLGVDDRDARVFWAYGEQRSTGRLYGVRIEWWEVDLARIENLRRASGMSLEARP